jgi:hypothetical protein
VGGKQHRLFFFLLQRDERGMTPLIGNGKMPV